MTKIEAYQPLPHGTHDVKLITETKRGTRLAHPSVITVDESKIEFTKAPFALKNEIKAMAGSRWHGYDEVDPKKVWTISNCDRNWFQLRWLMGENVYAWFERGLESHEYARPLRTHQANMADVCLTYHYQILGAEMGTGKTLTAIEVIERSKSGYWVWCGPLKSQENIEREFNKWKIHSDIRVEMTTPERLVALMANWEKGDPIPRGVIFDESSRFKNFTTKRTKAAYDLASLIRNTYGHDGYVILMSGTPSPKSPVDWWSQCEICYPGFIREGTAKAFEQRMAFMIQKEMGDGKFWQRIGWKNDEQKCEVCGMYKDEGEHDAGPDFDQPCHVFKPSFNEVSYFYQRAKGLVTVVHKKDCLDLPDKVYEQDICKPSASTLRAAKALVESAQNVITGITWLRELSDGFQYRDQADGTKICEHCRDSEEDGHIVQWYDPDDESRTYQSVDFVLEDQRERLERRWIPCPMCGGSQEMTKYKRIIRKVPTPKEAKLKARLAQCEETGRIVVFAGFQGSVDRVTGICRGEGWDVIRCDGRGWQVTDKDGNLLTEVDKPLEYWANTEDNPRVAFVAHPASGGLSLNLIESRMAVFWSNDFNPESRSQAEDRIHRLGMDENKGCKIVDIFHLPTDLRVREVLKENRKLELMTLGELAQDIQV